MLSASMSRVLATLIGLVGVLCAAASAPLLFTWVIDSGRPIGFLPLLVSAVLIVTAAGCFLLRRALLVWLASRTLPASSPQQAPFDA